MSYIGNTPTQQGFVPAIDYFSGNGTQTDFPLSRPVASVAQVQVVVENVPQKPGDAFTVVGNTLKFTGAIPIGTNNAYVYYTSPITQVIQPGQGTVTTATLVDGNVTPAKMSAGAPTWSQSNGVSLPRIDSTAEGGQLNLNRSSDDTNAWAFDVYGSGSTPALRVLDTVNGAEIQRWNQSGSIVLKGGSSSANGTGIAFPATQNPSSDANTLDDYEEGTWVPTVSGASGSASSVNANGTYTKIGRMVYVQCHIDFSKNTLSGQILIGGLPFVSGTSNRQGLVCDEWYQGNMSGTSFITGVINGSSTTMLIYGFSSTGGVDTIFSAAGITSTPIFMGFSGAYQTS